MVNIQIYKLNQIIDNIYFLKCENIILYISGISIKFYENIIKNYNENMNKLLEFIQDNKYISKNNFYKENKKYLVININDKINLNDYLLNCIYTYIYYYRSSLVDKFFEIIKRNIIYKKEYNPIFNPIINSEYERNINIKNLIGNKIYFNTNLFYDLKKLNLNITFKIKISNTLNHIIDTYNIFNPKNNISDICYKLDNDKYIKILSESKIMKQHFNLKDNYILINRLEKGFIETDEFYENIYDEEIIIKC